MFKNDSVKNLVKYVRWVLFFLIFSSVIVMIVLYRPKTGLKNMKVGPKEIKVELVSDMTKRAKGLSGRDGLAKDRGLLMIFEEPGKYGIWMKDMKFSIDIFWIRKNKIVYAEKNVPPPVVGTPDALLPVYVSSTEADMVLETAAGFADKNKIQAGDMAELVY
ncbi:MAG: DUF192 domain-containing protein [bacterium]|nr:DUF192 domain-containing protein [bacterium]